MRVLPRRIRVTGRAVVDSDVGDVVPAEAGTAPVVLVVTLAPDRPVGLPGFALPHVLAPSERAPHQNCTSYAVSQAAEQNMPDPHASVSW